VRFTGACRPAIEAFTDDVFSDKELEVLERATRIEVEDALETDTRGPANKEVVDRAVGRDVGRDVGTDVDVDRDVERDVGRDVEEML
jgi:hypothetical protein